MNTTLQNNIDKYMDIKGIHFYTDLLIAIAKINGKNRTEAEEFANNEKSNFSKMLKGERPLKYDYIIPLEKIFGVSLAKLLEEQAYKVEINKEDIPFLKSFRYYAYKDEYELYRELEKTYDKDGTDVIFNSDEYGKYFLDYLIEYRSFNGLKYLIDQRGFKLDPWGEKHYVIDDSQIILSSSEVEVARFVIDSDSPDYFKKVYDSYEHFIRLRRSTADTVFESPVFIESILNNPNIFQSIFDTKTLDFEVFNSGIEPKDGYKPPFVLINPLLNLCLDFSLKNIDKYKNQAKEILEFGRKHNDKAIKGLKYPLKEHRVDSFGNVYIGHRCYQASLLFTHLKTTDEEINHMIETLPTIKKEQ